MQAQPTRDDDPFIQPLGVSVMDKAGTQGVRFDNEGSGCGFRSVRRVEARQTELPHQCEMERP